MINGCIVVARNPRAIRQERSMTNPSVLNKAIIGLFMRGWYHGARGQPRIVDSGEYSTGYESGKAWLDFHGPDRRPHLTNAEDALRNYVEG